MARRSAFVDAIPDGLLVFRAEDWPTGEAWHHARRQWMASRPPRSLDDLNLFYGPTVTFPPAPDPRLEGLDAAA